MSQVDEGLVHAWLDGALPADEAQRIEALVRDDAAWAAAAAEARGLIANASRLMQALDDGVGAGGAPASRAEGPVAPALAVVPGAGAAPRRWVRRVAAAAAVLLVAVVGRQAWRSGADRSQETSVAVAPAPAERPAAPAPAAPAPAAALADGAPAKTADATGPAPARAKAARSAVEPPRTVATVDARPAGASVEPAAEIAATENAAPPPAMAKRAESARMLASPAAMQGASRAAAQDIAVARPSVRLEDGACVRFELLWEAEGDLPRAFAEVQQELRGIRWAGDTAHVEVPMPSTRVDGTTVSTIARVAVAARGWGGAAQLVRPDGTVARRGRVVRVSGCL